MLESFHNRGLLAFRMAWQDGLVQAVAVLIHHKLEGWLHHHSTKPEVRRSVQISRSLPLNKTSPAEAGDWFQRSLVWPYLLGSLITKVNWASSNNLA